MRGVPTTLDVDCSVDSRVGVIRLDRPRAINALTTAMLLDIGAALDEWEHDPGVQLVLLDGAGERGLCAGGDLRAMWSSAVAADGLAREFFRTEYRVNARVARFPKPFVALMDGIVMGGGVGLSAHADVRVVTERSTIAMPEVSIGLAPDVGGTHLLAHAPGHRGTHLALTGSSVAAGDAIWLGLADHFVPADRLDRLRELLRDGAEPGAAVAAVAEPAPEPELAGQQWIAACYAYATVEEIVAALLASEEPRAVATAAVLATRSPTALKVTLESLRRAAGMVELEQALEQEFRVSCAFLETADLVEGIRAQVIDKDRKPAWSPSRLEDVDAQVVGAFFDDRGHGDVGLWPVTRR